MVSVWVPEDVAGAEEFEPTQAAFKKIVGEKGVEFFNRYKKMLERTREIHGPEDRVVVWRGGIRRKDGMQRVIGATVEVGGRPLLWAEAYGWGECSF